MCGECGYVPTCFLSLDLIIHMWEIQFDENLGWVEVSNKVLSGLIGCFFFIFCSLSLSKWLHLLFSKQSLNSPVFLGITTIGLTKCMCIMTLRRKPLSPHWWCSVTGGMAGLIWSQSMMLEIFPILPSNNEGNWTGILPWKEDENVKWMIFSSVLELC